MSVPGAGAHADYGTLPAAGEPDAPPAVRQPGGAPARAVPRWLTLAAVSATVLVALGTSSHRAAPLRAASPTSGAGGVVSVPLQRRAVAGAPPNDLFQLRKHANGTMYLDLEGAFGPAAAAPLGLELSLASWEEWIESIFGRVADDGRRVRSRILHNSGNIEFLARVDIGTPPQPFELIADTGSSNTWVAGSACKAIGCDKMAKFDHASSSTFSELSKMGSRADGRFQLTYGTGDCEGFLGSDLVGVGGSVSTPLPIGIATSVAPFFKDVPWAAGILGLGLQSLSDGNLPTLLDSLQAHKRIARRVMSIYLASEHEAPSSQMTFGGPDPALYQPPLQYVRFVPLHGRYLYYVIEFDGFWVDGVPVKMSCTGNCKAVVDTGTSLLLGPPRDIDQIIKALGFFRCHTPRVLQVGIGGYLYSIPSDVFLLSESFDCVPALQPDTMMPGIFIFGDTFFRAVYTVFDNEDMRLGVAAHKNMPPPIPIP